VVGKPSEAQGNIHKTRQAAAGKRAGCLSRCCHQNSDCNLPSQDDEWPVIRVSHKQRIGLLESGLPLGGATAKKSHLTTFDSRFVILSIGVFENN
jgi:hypothetical protein